MITPDQIRAKARNKVTAILRCDLLGETGEPLIPWKVPFRTPKERDMSWKEVDGWRRELERFSKEKLGYGYIIRLERKQFHGKNDIPTAILFETADDVYRFAECAEEAARTKRAFAALTTAFPELKQWALRNLTRLVSLADEWPMIISCLQAYRARPAPNCYRREFSATPHSKYLEVHEKLFFELLDLTVDPRHLKTESNDFDQRFGFKKAPATTWLRFLDSTNRPVGLPTDLIALPIHTLSEIALPDQIVLSENKVPLLSLPGYKNTVGFFSEGMAAVRLAECSELQQRKLYYWGDLDCHGLAILSQVRARCPHVVPIAMDFATLNHFDRWATKTTIELPATPANLTSSETELFLYLKKNNLRLEHERIPHAYVLKTFESLRFERLFSKEESIASR